MLFDRRIRLDVFGNQLRVIGHRGQRQSEKGNAQ
jgi:hypothetical protein